jgi:hypothetical protein
MTKRDEAANLFALQEEVLKTKHMVRRSPVPRIEVFKMGWDACAELEAAHAKKLAIGNCRECKRLWDEAERVKSERDTLKKEFEVLPAAARQRVKNSKSKLLFCSRKCRDIGMKEFWA